MRSLRKLWTLLIAIVLSLSVTGCWDRKEVNDLALVMAQAIDLTADHQVRVSDQVAIPSKVGGSTSGSGKGEGGKSFYVVSGVGRTVSEADERVQEKLPRELYLPHLRVIVVGEDMAKSGMAQILDHYGRNPPNRLRSALLVAKGSDALTLLTTTYPLESISGEAIRKLERQLLGVNTTLLDYLIEASSIGSDQFTSAISLRAPVDASGQSGEQEAEGFAFEHQAVFRELKLVGYLDTPESIALQMMKQHIRHIILTADVPKKGGTISVDLTQVKRRGRTIVKGNQVYIDYELSGSAMMTENTTGLDADNPKNIKVFQDALNQYIEQTSTSCIKTLATDFNADALGIGEMVYHQHPYDWERLKGNWYDHLKNVKYTVTSQVKIVEAGKSGPPLYGKTHRGIKGDNINTEIGGGDSQ